jgi:alpha-beta hydrolase superfamily lysophospholipase
MESTSTYQSAFAAPSLSLLATEPLRALLDHLAARVGSAPLPIGDGHPVVVYPGLGAGAMTTSHLRRYLTRSGFEMHDWEGGINTGPTGVLDDWLASLQDRVQSLHRQHGRKVSLIGWSLGGVYARELAKRCPDSVRQVITLATPFNSLGGGNHAGTIYKLLNRDSSQLTPEVEARLRECPPVPTTSIYSKTDGIVAWRGCIEKKTERSENVEVAASHLGMVSHSEVLRIIANRLAQPEGQWRPLRRSERLGRSRQRG